MCQSDVLLDVQGVLKEPLHEVNVVVPNREPERSKSFSRDDLGEGKTHLFVNMIVSDDTALWIQLLLRDGMTPQKLINPKALSALAAALQAVAAEILARAKAWQARDDRVEIVDKQVDDHGMLAITSIYIRYLLPMMIEIQWWDFKGMPRADEQGAA
jgi:hypothetical protein